ncbi:FMN-dependent NADH-azoreductase [Agarivorans sp. Toyoura001]|uniref:FMN-dependent NADH-azoreductase n=1 Tax=unclassified Agarivorans TaxID=2636026 RepID=UPI0010F25C79|nr:FMN-dependent NADH-azoreductase [Agarivorans sp. Toyoura001]GDY24613.1 FMN-dependent NADH-azoreductase [Agarivorans sp. Toyoura001]
MTSVLTLKSSILGEHSSSSALIDQLSNRYIAQHAKVVSRDLAAEPLPVLSAEVISALQGGDELSEQQRKVFALSNSLVDELKAADVVVIAAPMYNFSIPTQLKNWLDLVVRAGLTFQYSEQGPVGLIKDTKAIVVTTRGGIHKHAATDTQIPHLMVVLGFLGITDVEVVYAEALSMGDETAKQQMDAAQEQLAALV